MKKLALVVIAASLLGGTNIFAQPTPPIIAAAGVPGPGPHLGGPKPVEKNLRPVMTIPGKVAGLKANDDFTLDGFYLLNSNDSLLVKFPPHMGSEIMPVVKTGSQVTVSGVMENPPSGMKEIIMVSLKAGDKTLTETFPGMPNANVQETTLNGNGKISTLQKDPEGRVTGLFIDNKTLLRLPPHVAAELGASISTGAAISYSGSQKSRSKGEVQLEDYKIIRCSTITVNGQQYLVK